MEFEKVVKKEYYKTHKKICKKCGRKDYIHLHHILELARGGTNDFDNLIPLCMECHYEWHGIEDFIDFDTWLTIPPYRVMAICFLRSKELIDLPFNVSAKTYIDIQTSVFKMLKTTEVDDEE